MALGAQNTQHEGESPELKETRARQELEVVFRAMTDHELGNFMVWITQFFENDLATQVALREWIHRFLEYQSGPSLVEKVAS